MSTIKSRPLRVFILYAHEDERLCERLRRHLEPLELFDIRSSRDIQVGAPVEQWIRVELDNADIILPLISVDFLYQIIDDELARALRRATARVVPIVVRHCAWRDSSELETFDMLRGGEPPTREEDWIEIADFLGRLGKNLLQSGMSPEPRRRGPGAAGVPLRVLMVSAHEDDPLGNALFRHLRPLQTSQLFELRDLRQESVAMNEEEVLSRELDRADMVLLLVSADFVSSDFLFNQALGRILAKATIGEVKVIPIIVRPCLWQEIPHLAGLKVPRNGKPPSGPDDDQAWTEIAMALREEGTSLRMRRTSGAPDKMSAPPSRTAENKVGARSTPGLFTPMLARISNAYSSVRTLFSSHVVSALVIDGELEDLDTDALEDAVARLRELSGDPTLRTKAIEPGSIKIVIETTRQGYLTLRVRHSKGEIPVLCGGTLVGISPPRPVRRVVERPEAPLVVISFASKDKHWRDRVREHLGTLQVEGKIRVWDEDQISMSDELVFASESAHDAASAAILLLSATYLASHAHCQQASSFLTYAEEGGLRVWPLVIRPCAWDQKPWLTDPKVRPSLVPSDGRALASMKVPGAEKVLSDLVSSLASSLNS